MSINGTKLTSMGGYNMIPQTFTVTCQHIRFYFLVFFRFTLFSCRFRAVD